jgi:pimeloyl-ACP methyl ester carboxylesterase
MSAPRIVRVLAALAALACVVLLTEEGIRSTPGSVPVPAPARSAVAAAGACPALGPGVDPWADQLGTHTLADRGAILACAHVAHVTLAEVARSPLFWSSIGPPTDGYDLFVIQYVSEGRPGVARAKTALFYLPDGGRSGVPLVAYDHATSGMGPSCGPTHVHVMSDPFAVPLAGRGYAVVAPDYGGMGIDNGMTSYLVGDAEAAATLDAVRAVRRFGDPRFDPKRMSDELFLAGYSQGGHAALFAHQHFDASLGVRLLGSIAMGPGLGDARRWLEFVQGARRPVGGMEVYASMMLFAGAQYAGGPEPGAWLSPKATATLPTVFHGQCSPNLEAAVASAFLTLGDLYQPAFLDAAASCKLGVACPGFEPWASRLHAAEPGDFTSDAPSLILQGLADTLVPPATTACIVDRMRARGTPVEACGYPNADHFSFLAGAVPDMVRWIAARHAGKAPDACAVPLAAACDPH